MLQILWNHSYLWGSMFVGSKHFPGSWGCNFVVSLIRIILTNIHKWLCTGSWGCKFVGKGYPQALVPQEQWWFHSILYHQRNNLIITGTKFCLVLQECELGFGAIFTLKWYCGFQLKTLSDVLFVFIVTYLMNYSTFFL